MQTRCVVIQLVMDRSRRVSVVLTLMAILPTYDAQFSKNPSVLESFWLVASHLHFDKDLLFCFMADFDTDCFFNILSK